jgi:hypothetical protein
MAGIGAVDILLLNINTMSTLAHDNNLIGIIMNEGGEGVPAAPLGLDLTRSSNTLFSLSTEEGRIGIAYLCHSILKMGVGSCVFHQGGTSAVTSDVQANL